MPMRLGTPIPDLSGASEWLNGPVRRHELRGQVVLVHFWAMSCHICHENMPTLERWRQDYGPQGLTMIAIHMPRQESDLDVEKIRHEVQLFHISEPCGIDNTHALADAFANQYVPAYFLFDREGNLRGRTAGTVGLQTLENTIVRYLKTAEDVPSP